MGARRLGRAISVVSYGISNLEAQLGVALFDREGSRKPQLTEAGRAVLASARAVARCRRADGAGARPQPGAGGRTHPGGGRDVSHRDAGQAAPGFLMAFPTVDLRLHVEALGAVAGQLLDGQADGDHRGGAGG
jgi:DNA-binding transcriptional LysR family regulator